MKNNRSLNDKCMNELDHALGRPDCPLIDDAGRNFFGVSVDSAAAKRMKASPLWTHTRDFMGTSGFIVSDEGRKALSDYLVDNWTPPRRYKVEYEYDEGKFTEQIVNAETPSKARYMAWDSDFHGSFKNFLSCIRSVRIYRPILGVTQCT